MEIILKDISYGNQLEKSTFVFNPGVTVLAGRNSKAIIEVITSTKVKGAIFVNGEKCKKNETIRNRISYVPGFTSLKLEDELEEKINPFKLSLSEKKKLILKLTLEKNKDVIVLDNPNIGLDVNNLKSLIREINSLKLNKKIVIVISDDVEFIQKTADYIYLIDKKIVLEGNKQTFFSNKDVLKEYGISIPKTVEFINYVLKSKGVNLGYRNSLEDVVKDVYRSAK